jgi:hypothetical protein
LRLGVNKNSQPIKNQPGKQRYDLLGFDKIRKKNCREEMKTNTNIKYEEALKNAESYIEEMKTWDDKKRCKHLDLFQKQMQMAYEQGNHEAFELLQEYERQVITSRIQAAFKE